LSGLTESYKTFEDLVKRYKAQFFLSMSSLGTTNSHLGGPCSVTDEILKAVLVLQIYMQQHIHTHKKEEKKVVLPCIMRIKMKLIKSILVELFKEL
jgi:hypothetical protein